MIRIPIGAIGPSPTTPPPTFKYDLKAIFERHLAALDPKSCALVLEEAQRLQELLCSTPWYAEKARRSGGESWLDLAPSYRING